MFMRSLAAIVYLMFCLVVVAVIVPDSREGIFGRAEEKPLAPEQEAAEADRRGMTVPEHRKFKAATADNARQTQHLAAAIVAAGAFIGGGLYFGLKHHAPAPPPAPPAA